MRSRCSPRGALVAAVLQPSAAVTPITPAADPPTTPRTVITGTFTLPPDLAAATTVEVIGRKPFDPGHGRVVHRHLR